MSELHGHLDGVKRQIGEGGAQWTSTTNNNSRQTDTKPHGKPESPPTVQWHVGNRVTAQYLYTTLHNAHGPCPPHRSPALETCRGYIYAVDNVPTWPKPQTVFLYIYIRL